MGLPTVLITGCTAGGIGDALCREYSKSPKRYRVVAALRSPEKINAHLKASGALDLVVKMDVTSEESVRAAIEEIQTKMGGIDILINNAGSNLATGPGIEVPLSRYQGTFDVNYFGLMRVTQAATKDMIKRRQGTIVNIGSSAGLSPLPFSAAYASSKAAVHALSDCLRVELAPLGIRVLCVAPGRIQSEIGKASLDSVTRPPTSSPYHSAISSIERRAMYSQSGSPTPAADLARAIRTQTEYSSTSLWSRHYLVYGASSTVAWLFSYLPCFVRDAIFSRYFKVGLVGKENA